MSELNTFVKYILAQAEHGSLKFVKLEKKLTEEELNTLFRRAPFLIDNKYTLWCSPIESPTFCIITTQGLEYKCQMVLPFGRVQCYNSVTGTLLRTSESRTLFDGLRRAYELCMLRVRYMNSKLGTQNVPSQNTPEGEPKDKIEEIINRLYTSLGIPKDQAIVTPQPSPPPLKEDIPELRPCYELAKITKVVGFIEALNVHDFDKALSQMVDVGIKLAEEDELEQYARMMNECVSVLKSKK